MSVADGAGAPTWPDVLTSLLDGHDLDLPTASWAMGEVMSGAASPVQLAGLLVALRAKGESVDELRGLADVMLEHAVRIEVPGETLDIVGTGGDRHNTVNISTMSALVVAATGVRVVKHGNRAASSASGTADVLEALGVRLGLEAEQVPVVAREAGITFCFARTFHPAMRHAAEARSGLGVPTLFNALGPLTNPAQPRYSAVGVANPRFLPLIAGVFADRGQSALVFRGDDGLDELTVSTSSSLRWVAQGEVAEGSITPEDVGLTRAPLEALRGGVAAENAEVVRRVVAGDPGPVRDAVLLNAGAALALAAAGGEPVDDPVAAIGDGVERAAAAVDDGSARVILDRWVAVSTDDALLARG